MDRAADAGADGAGVGLPASYRIRDLGIDDAAALAEAYVRNAEHLAPWEPPRDGSFFTTAGQEAAIAGRLGTVAAGYDASWVLVHGGDVVGRVNLNNVVMGPFRSGSVGYWIDHEHLGRGLATAAVRFACAWAVRHGLHRVEAGTLVHNVASQGVLRKCGFVHYGRAPQYLYIAGAWRDHELYQRILHDRAP